MEILVPVIFQALIYPSIAIGVVAVTLSKSKMFGWLRARIALGGLLKCPYCLAHWLAFGAAAARPMYLEWTDYWLLNWFVQSMVLVGLSTATIWLLQETYFGHED